VCVPGAALAVPDEDGGEVAEEAKCVLKAKHVLVVLPAQTFYDSLDFRAEKRPLFLIKFDNLGVEVVLVLIPEVIAVLEPQLLGLKTSEPPFDILQQIMKSGKLISSRHLGS